MQFAYLALDEVGKMQSGSVDAEFSIAASHKLCQDGPYAVSLEEEKAKVTVRIPLFGRRVSRSEVVYTTCQLGVMIDPGISLSSAIGGLAAQTDNLGFKSMLKKPAGHRGGRQLIAGSLAFSESLRWRLRQPSEGG